MYQVLYRKWRPQAFTDVYGQPHVTTALQNEMKNHRLAHAYLFTGSRGTGKTTCAKILAKAVNCLHPIDGNPCNECDACHGIDDGSVLDVVEIDAASNNGVDNIRDLREEVNYTPASVKYRVYIIDEVHMLSTGAFNALLKTLEEPPEHVIFILATTEVHKLPATILSRCQRFDFARIPPEDIAARMQEIAEKENFTIADDAALLIARLADGALRDALSLLDQCTVRSSEVTVDVVTKAAGMAGGEHLKSISLAIKTRSVGQALSLIHELYERSCDMERLCTDLLEYYRNLMILKSVNQADGLIIAAPAELAQMTEDAAGYDLVTIVHIMDALQSSLERLKSGANQRVEMELAMMRLCSPELDSSSAALMRRMKLLEDRLLTGQPMPAAAAVSAPVQKGMPFAESSRDDTDEMPSPPSAPAAAEPALPEGPFAQWNDVLELLNTACPPLYGVLFKSQATVRGDMILIHTENDLFKSLVTRDGNKNVMINAIKQVSGKTYRIGIKKSVPKTSVEDNDPLGEFLRRSESLGVEVKIQE